MNDAKPAKGRAIINDNGYRLQIIVPLKKDLSLYFLIAFLCAEAGGFLVLTVQTLQNSNIDVFIILESIFLIIIVAVSIWLVAWCLKGKEIITLFSGTLEIRAKALHIGKLKRFSFSGIRDLRLGSNGTLAFDYGRKTVDFAHRLDTEEAVSILELIKRRIAA